jgi:hypothetical protein
MNLATARRAWQRWQDAAGPWQGWSVCPTLLSPELQTLDPPPRRRSPNTRRLALRLGPVLESGNTLCLIDLAPESGVQIAAQLASVAYPVLLLPRWPYARAVLPVDGLLATLLAESRRLPRTFERRSNVVFVVDGERARALPGRRAGDPRADNRHSLSAFDLPDLRTLRQRGIQRIVRVVKCHPELATDLTA